MPPYMGTGTTDGDITNLQLLLSLFYRISQLVSIFLKREVKAKAALYVHNGPVIADALAT